MNKKGIFLFVCFFKKKKELLFMKLTDNSVYSGTYIRDPHLRERFCREMCACIGLKLEALSAGGISHDVTPVL